MKKTATLILAVIFILSMTACGENFNDGGLPRRERRDIKNVVSKGVDDWLSDVLNDEDNEIIDEDNEIIDEDNEIIDEDNEIIDELNEQSENESDSSQIIKSAIPLILEAPVYFSGDFKYLIYEGVIWIIGYTGESPTVDIPSEIDGFYVEGIYNEAFRDNRIVSTVILPYGIKSIGNGAFWGCSALEDINIPDSMTYIEPGAFAGCYMLKNARHKGVVFAVMGDGWGNFDFHDMFYNSVNGKDEEN